MRAIALLGCALLACVATAPAVTAQTEAFPSRPITILVPFPPGGTADVVTRALAQKVGNSLKTNVLIDNRSGGGGTVAALATKQAAPDGYTLFLTNNGLFAITPALSADMRFDPIRDFQPITPLVLFPSVLVVPQGSPARTVKELVELGKTKPGGLSYGSQGVGSGGHILGEMLRLKTGVPMVHVPYRGAGPALTDLAGGSIDFIFTSYISAAGQVQAGKVRLLGVSAAKRSAGIPDVPTMAETGFPGTELEIWHGLVAPAGTPGAIVHKLNEEFVKAAQAPDIVSMVTAQATEILTSTPEEFAKLIAADIDRLGAVVRQAGIKMQ